MTGTVIRDAIVAQFHSLASATTDALLEEDHDSDFSSAVVVTVSKKPEAVHHPIDNGLRYEPEVFVPFFTARGDCPSVMPVPIHEDNMLYKSGSYEISDQAGARDS